MELSDEELTRIRAAWATVGTILNRIDTGTLSKWAHDHLIYTPGSRVPVAEAVTKATQDIGFPVTARQLGRVVPAPRIKSNGSVYYANVRLV